MATIPLTETARAFSDTRQWNLQRRHRKEDGEWSKWKTVSHYHTMQGLISGLAEACVRESQAETLPDLLEDVKRIGIDLSDALRPHISVNAGEVRK